jgi:sugar lactone lactonase YvrE
VKRTLVVVSGALVAAVSIAAGAGAGGGGGLEDRIDLPDGFQPEGVASKGAKLYVGSIPTGDIYRANARTGNGEVVVDAPDGRSALGLQVTKRERLYVAGGETGMAFSYSAKTGADRGALELAPEPPTFVNDVTLDRGKAYFTDSMRPVLYVVKKDMSSFKELELRGFKQRPGFNLNGIVDTRGRTLISMQGNTGDLWRIDARTGKSRRIRVDGNLKNGDGLVLRGRTLYVVRNQNNKVAVVKLERNLKRGEVVDRIRSDDFDVPTTAAAVSRSLFVVNARFLPEPMPDDEYWLTRVRP